MLTPSLGTDEIRGDVMLHVVVAKSPQIGISPNPMSFGVVMWSCSFLYGVVPFLFTCLLSSGVIIFSYLK
jgi:hypothetical protein